EIFDRATATTTRRDRAATTATRSNDDDKIERRRRDRATATRSSVSFLTKQTRSSDDGEIERRRRQDRTTTTRSSDGDEIECIFSHEADEIERRRGDRATTATRSSKNHNLLKLEMISNWGVGRAFILLFHTTVNPDPISLLIAEYVPFRSDKMYATTQVKAPPQLQKTVLVHDIWVFEKSLFHTGACWRLYGRIEFPSKDIIQHAL
ncbi:unnamed protein product, partial [Brassica oleracea var. botrytis]